MCCVCAYVRQCGSVRMCVRVHSPCTPGTANLGETQASLDFRTTARSAITQDIPVINNTAQQWVIKVRLRCVYSCVVLPPVWPTVCHSPLNPTTPTQAALKGQYFTGAPQLLVQPNSTATYTLQFKPAWVCDVQGELVLLNTTTSDRHVYTLHVRAVCHIVYAWFLWMSTCWGAICMWRYCVCGGTHFSFLLLLFIFCSCVSRVRLMSPWLRIASNYSVRLAHRYAVCWRTVL